MCCVSGVEVIMFLFVFLCVSIVSDFNMYLIFWWMAAERAFTSNCAQQNMTQVKGVFRTLFRRTSSSLLSAGATNELLLENNVACDMPGQIPYVSWLILIMPLSTSMLNCAISFGKRRAGGLFYIAPVVTPKRAETPLRVG